MDSIKDTSTSTFRQIFTNGLYYKVPTFQRDYSWTEEQWDDLWEDLLMLNRKDEKSHYMGYLVLQTNNEKDHSIIDGQQRLTTISILILALIKQLKENGKNLQGKDKKDNETRIEKISENFIGNIDTVSLAQKNKLILNRNNNFFYKNSIVSSDNNTKLCKNKSNELLMKCLLWFSKKIKEEFKESLDKVKFIEMVVDKIFFTVIKVSDELNAYKVFETLNARGVQLSSSDLLKNYLFSKVDVYSDKNNDSCNDDLNELQELWQYTYDNLGTLKIEEYVRYFWNSKHKTVRKRDLFRKIKKQVTCRKEVFKLLHDLKNNVELYVALIKPDEVFWENDPEIMDILKNLKDFNAKQPISLLLVAYDLLEPDEFKRVLRIIETIYLRYNIICGFNPNDEEKVFNDIVIDLINNKKIDKSKFKKIYPSDKEFKESFVEKEFVKRQHKIVKYILLTIENTKNNSSLDIRSKNYSVEHILPENPDESWKMEKSKLKENRHKLGNMTILQIKENRNIQNDSFEKKKKTYIESKLLMNEHLSNTYNNWNEKNIQSRGKYLANQACGIWKINF